MPSWPTSLPYLILHKVRGEPAFDIAVKMEVECESDPGPWWIIPTSGHRAYPCWQIALDIVLDSTNDYWYSCIVNPQLPPSDVPDDLRDHYEDDDLCLTDTTPTQTTTDLLALIGASRSQPPVTRRR